MLADEAVRVGPLNVPVWMLAIAGALVIVAILQRTVWRERRDEWKAANDLVSTALVIAMIVWKLTPLVTRFPEIREAPGRLLYYPGGMIGAVAGGLAALLYVFVRLRRLEPPRRGLLVQAAVPLLAAVMAAGVTMVVPSGDELEFDLARLDYLAGHEAGLDPDAPTVITAWATWCGPCTAQMPEVERFHREFGDRVNLVALNLTSTERSENVVRAYLAAGELTFPVALDHDGSVASALAVRATPTTIVVDTSGRERARRTGAVNEDWLARRVLPQLR